AHPVAERAKAVGAPVQRGRASGEAGMNARRWWDVAAMRLRSLARRGRVESDLDRELRFHLEQQEEENLARGMSPEEARAAALRGFGGVAQVEEPCRD